MELEALIESWEQRSRAAHPVDAMLINKHVRELRGVHCRIEQSRNFYMRRCEALQAAQNEMRDPERKAVCDILANGSTEALSKPPSNA